MHDLNLSASYSRPDTQFSKLKGLLNQCSGTAEKLNDKEEEHEENKQKPWTSFKELTLFKCSDDSDSKAFWLRSWKQCDQVERLSVLGISGIADSLAMGMVHMPNLDEIDLGP